MSDGLREALTKLAAEWDADYVDGSGYALELRDVLRLHPETDTAETQWPSEAVRSSVWKTAKAAALEKWQTGSADTTQMLMCVNAALEAVIPDLLDRHPESDGGAAAPGGIDHPVSAGPASEATSTAAPSSPDHTHGCADHGTRYLVVEIPPAASEADADAITDLVANHVYSYKPTGPDKAWDPFIHGWTWPDEVPHSVGRAPLVLSRDAVAEALMVHQVELVDAEVGFACGCDEQGELYLPTFTQVSEHLADAIVALARSEQEVREQIADAIEGIAEFCKDYYAETGEVLIPRDVAARIARGER